MLLHDGKPAVVRPCLGALYEVAHYRPELNKAIKEELLEYGNKVEKISMKDQTVISEKL